jgi:nicotinamidase-related amidase
MILKGVKSVKKAIICLDVQQDFLGNTLDYIAPLCQKYLNQRGNEYSVIILTHWVYDELEGKNTLLLSHPNAYVIEKTTYSGYNEKVRQVLEEHQIEEVHLAGVDSELSVLATMFSLVDAGYKVKVLERLVSSYHGRNWEAMMIARHAIGAENVIPDGGDRVWI